MGCNRNGCFGEVMEDWRRRTPSSGKFGRALGTRMGFRGHAPAAGQIASIGTWKQKIRNKRRED